MKKVINKKELIIIVSVLVISLLSVKVFAIDSVLGNDSQTINSSQYTTVQSETSTSGNNTTNGNNLTSENNSNSNINSNTNNVKTYNTNNNVDLPQTGIEDYNIGILIIICIASAIFAYKKINYYKNV